MFGRGYNAEAYQLAETIDEMQVLAIKHKSSLSAATLALKGLGISGEGTLQELKGRYDFTETPDASWSHFLRFEKRHRRLGINADAVTKRTSPTTLW